MHCLSVGIFYSFGSSVLLAGFHLVSFEFVKDITWSTILTVVYGVEFLIMLVYNILAKKPFKPADGEYIAVILNIISHVSSAILTQLSLLYITPFESTIIANLNLYFVAISAFLYYGEPLDILDLLSISITFFGMLIWCKPEIFFDAYVQLTSSFLKGFGLSIGIALALTSLAITGRKAVNTSSTFISMCSGLLTVIMTLICSSNSLEMKQFVSNNLESITNLSKVVFLMSPLLIFGEICIIKAYQNEEATSVAFVFSLKIFWTIIAQSVILNDYFRRYEAIGFSIITLGFFLFLLKKFMYQKFKFGSKNCLPLRLSNNTHEEF